MIVATILVTCVVQPTLSIDPTPKPESDETRLATAITQFGLNFLKNLSDFSKKNVVFSPLSLQIALSMVLLGVNSTSRSEKELAKVLGYESTGLFKAGGANDTIAHRAMLSLTQSLTALDGSSGDEKLSLKLANLVLSDKDEVKLNETYKTALKTYYDVKLEEFSGKESKAALVERINTWVKTKTLNQIDKLVREKDLEDVVIMLLNAAHFKAQWLSKFDTKMTQTRDFFNHGSAKEASKAQFMRQTDVDLDYANLDSGFCWESNKSVCKLNCKVLSLPFSPNNGSELSMVFLLPLERDGISNLQAKLDVNALNEVYKSLKRETISISLPKFSFEFMVSANKILKKLGLEKVFTKEANLGRMVENNTKTLQVSEVLHKAKVTVDESGAEAAAVTSVITSWFKSRYDSAFIVDHPFVFIIRHSKSNVPLFMGRIEDLRQ